MFFILFIAEIFYIELEYYNLSTKSFEKQDVAL